MANGLGETADASIYKLDGFLYVDPLNTASIGIAYALWIWSMPLSEARRSCTHALPAYMEHAYGTYTKSTT